VLHVDALLVLVSSCITVMCDIDLCDPDYCMLQLIATLTLQLALKLHLALSQVTTTSSTSMHMLMLNGNAYILAFLRLYFWQIRNPQMAT
jgi:hypothetical protein